MTYNGWSNYATWKVALEVFDGMEFEDTVTESLLEDLAEEIIFGDKDRNNLVSSYAQSFLEDVDYREIAENINEEILE
jgi:hypothetical protein